MAIQVLDQLTINKIAAGEVIERPSSVVKELVENSIDAGASSITVEIKEGGISFIRITDNGSGFEKEDIPVAFLRHSTSKIKTVEDLFTVKSLGFRGEALSSISAVAQIELVTKTHDALMGTRYVIEGGKEKEIEAVGCPDGTTFIIRNLFFNTPARRKFLKSPVTEGGYISELIERLAMSHPEVSFRFIVNGQNKLHTSGNGNMKDIIYHIYGREIASNVIPVDYNEGVLKIRGFIGKPVVNRGNRNYENYFINGRFIRSNIINKAIEEAYKAFMMQHKYPFTTLHFSIDSSYIDVNVHPTKMELRFTNGQEIYNIVYDQLTKALTHKEFIPDVGFDKNSDAIKHKPVVEKNIPEVFESKRIQNNNIKQVVKEPDVYNNVTENKPDIEISDITKNVMSEKISMIDENIVTKISDLTGKNESSIVTQVVPVQIKDTKQITLFEENENKVLLDEKSVINHKIIGQVFDTYWIIQFEDKMYIIDQHAAHEKVLYERVMARFKNNKTASQNLMPPVIVNLSINDVTVLNENMEYFNYLGYEIEPFGGKDYALTAVPLELYGLNEKDVFIEILDEMSAGNFKMITSITDRMATIACKAAVKGNNRLSFDEAKELINELLTLDNPYNCPHGRPTIISMSKYEMEKKFKRIV